MLLVPTILQFHSSHKPQHYSFGFGFDFSFCFCMLMTWSSFGDYLDGIQGLMVASQLAIRDERS